MDLIKAILLGIIEGVTEFLPISSTGHLILAGQWLDLPGALAATFDIFIQLGAILAVVWLYRRRILDMLVRLPRDRSVQWFAVALALAFVPAAGLGVLFYDTIKAVLFTPVVVATALIAGGVIMLVLDRDAKTARYNELESVPPLTGLGIGVAQALSLIPGMSRSAATILGGLALGLNRQTAVDFSFFLSIPIMVIATLYDLAKSARGLGQSDFLLLGVGFVTAFVTALVVVRWFLRYIAGHNFVPFAVYRIILGALVLGLAALGRL